MTVHSALCKIMMVFSPSVCCGLVCFAWWSNYFAGFLFLYPSFFIFFPCLYSRPFLLLVHCHQTISTLFIYWRSINRRAKAEGKSKWKVLFFFGLKRKVDGLWNGLSVWSCFYCHDFCLAFHFFACLFCLFIYFYPNLLLFYRMYSNVREATTIQRKLFILLFQSSPQPAIGFVVASALTATHFYFYTFSGSNPPNRVLLLCADGITLLFYLSTFFPCYFTWYIAFYHCNQMNCLHVTLLLRKSFIFYKIVTWYK